MHARRTAQKAYNKVHALLQSTPIY